ncbi:MAG: hypothetical protein RI958_2974 [Actinomycetota bacterium]
MTGSSARPSVAVNMLWCLPGAVGGSEQYLVRQLAGAFDVDPQLELSICSTAGFRDVHGSRLSPADFRISSADAHRRWRRVLTENTWLFGATSDVDLVHHGGGTAPRRARRPYLLTIHDLQYRTFPHYFSRVKRSYLDAVVPGSARRAARVAVPTEYVRDSVVRELGVPAERVGVVPHGYEPELLEQRSDAQELRSRLGLGDGPILVYPAMTAPHKNHRFLVEMMRTRWDDPDLRLVLIGGHGLASDDVAARIAEAERERPGRIIHAGRVGEADKNGLIALAAALVFPSLYEGFGAPLIEAMALGTPVLCSDSTCLPQVAGDAAVVAPLDPTSWAEGLDTVLARRERLTELGRERVSHFTARRSGEALVAMYAEAAA